MGGLPHGEEPRIPWGTCVIPWVTISLGCYPVDTSMLSLGDQLFFVNLIPWGPLLYPVGAIPWDTILVIPWGTDFAPTGYQKSPTG